MRLAWAGGWLLAQEAASASLIFEPTDEALRAFDASLPYGLAGAGLMLAAALARFAYRGWLSALWFSLLPVVTLVLFARETRGAPLFWQVLCLLSAVGLLTWDVARRARYTGRSRPVQPR